MADDDGLDDPVDSTTETAAKIITLPDGTRFISAPRWVIKYAGRATRFFRRPAAWLIMVLTGGWISYSEAASRLAESDSPLAPVGLLVDEYLFQTILLPVAVSMWDALVGSVDTAAVIIYGGDRRLGLTEGTTPGLVDLPLVIADVIIGPVAAVTGGITGSIASMNASVASSIEPLGLAAPVVVAGLWTFEMFLALWFTWTLLEAIPGFDITDVVLSYTAPIRNILRGLT